MTGTEIAFRLPPGSGDQARAIADRLARLAPAALEHVLFLDVDAGEYGCLAVWPSADAAAAYIGLPEVAAEIAALGERMGKPTRVRTYVMEYQYRVPPDDVTPA
jgi:hypothetical protein